MRGKSFSKTIVLAAAAASLAVWGCDGDEFSDAPAAQAGASQSSQGSDRGGLGPVEGSELPPGHPPLAPDQQRGQQQAPPPQGTPQANPVERIPPAEYGQRGPILWDSPDHWEPREPQGTMRFAEYGVRDGAELTIFYFGPDSGGAAEGNLQRWESQLTGGPAPAKSVTEIDGMTVHRFDGQGTYHADLPGVSDGPVEDQRMLGAIVETSQGLFFFRLLGDRQVVDDEVEGFDSFVKSFRDGA